jgi:hypothetical protein
MKKSVKEELRSSWIEFRKECTWNNFKGFACGVLPLTGWMYLYTQWMKLVNPLLDEYSKSSNNVVVVTQHDAILSLCVLIGFVAPLFISFPVMSFGFWFGRVTKLYVDNKTRSVWWDDKTYLVRDMPDEDRQKIASILFPYKSKLQLQKEKKANQSWFRRNFL